MPLKEHEKGSFKYATKEAGEAFFKPRPKAKETTKILLLEEERSAVLPPAPVVGIQPIDLCKAVSSMVNDVSFREQHKSKGAPLAMVAFAKAVSEMILQPKNETVGFAYFL